MCYVGYFINGDGWKLTAGYICRTFYIWTKLYIFIFQGHICQQFYILRDKNNYLS